jgi:RNA polymerase primary sigma factor
MPFGGFAKILLELFLKKQNVRISAEKELVLRRFNRIGCQDSSSFGGQVTIDPESLEGSTRYKAEEMKRFLMMGIRTSSLDALLVKTVN